MMMIIIIIVVLKVLKKLKSLNSNNIRDKMMLRIEVRDNGPGVSVEI